MRFKGILLDLDNTVYAYTDCHEPALDASLKHLSTISGLDHDSLNQMYDVARDKVKQKTKGTAASHSRFLYFQRMCEMLDQAPYELAPNLDNLYWSTYMDYMVFRPHFADFLDAIKPMPIAIVTDMTADWQLKKIVRLGLQEHITAVVTSEEAGHDKPHPDIFALAADKLSTEPGSLCMIGDSWEKDILGALQFNMHCFWLKEETKADLNQLQSFEPNQQELVHEFKSFKNLIGQVAAVV